VTSASQSWTVGAPPSCSEVELWVVVVSALVEVSIVVVVPDVEPPVLTSGVQLKMALQQKKGASIVD
jgi:hypothetical protein